MPIKRVLGEIEINDVQGIDDVPGLRQELDMLREAMLRAVPKGVPQPTGATIVARFIAGTGETFSGTDLINWEDQSGNGYHATQTGTAGPSDETAGTTRVAWDKAKGRPALDLWNTTTGYMVLSASQQTNLRNCAVLAVVRRNNSALHQANNPTFNGLIGFDANNMLWIQNPRILSLFVPGTDPGTGAVKVGMTTSPEVIGFRGSATGTDFAVADRIVTSATAPPVSTISGGFIGRGLSSSYGFDHVIHEVVFLKDCDAGTFAAWAKHLQWKWDGNGTVGAGNGTKTRSLVFVGDSTVAGEPWYTTNPIIPEQIAERRPNVAVLSMAINSQLVSTAGGNHVATQISNVSHMLDGSLATGESVCPLVNRICVIMGGTNDINSAVSAATLKAAFTSRVAEAKALGATHVAICTIMDSVFHDSTEDTVRATINADIKNLASGIGHDICINLHETANGGDDRFNDATANVDSVFQDGLHPSYFGSTVLSQLIENQLASLL